MGLAYQGSKRRLLPILSDIARTHSRGCSAYVEPFLGGANAIDANVHRLPMILADANGELIALYRALVDGWIPPMQVSRSEWLEAKGRPEGLPLHVVGWRLLMASGRYRYDNTMFQTDPGKRGDLVSRPLKQHVERGVYLGAVMRSATLLAASYEALDIPAGAYVYCDPPYKGTADYGGKDFDSEAFYSWAEKTASEYGRVVVVSEYSAPSHWPLLHSQELLQTIGKANTKRTERLYLARAKTGVVLHGGF